jgi:hypothetical protein
MKKFLIIFSLFLSGASFADYTCYPSKKNEFAINKIILELSADKVSITEVPNSELEGTRVGEALFKGNAKADGKYLTFDHALYSSIQKVKDSSPSPLSNWFGEGYGEVLVGQDVLANEPNGRMAIAWCYHWCNYDYYSCNKNN